MAIKSVTPRDRLQHLADLGRKAARYWWLVAVFAVIGGGLSLAFAVLRTKTYQSWATIFYQEKMNIQVLSPTREEIAQRNIGDKYRELLIARDQLGKIVDDESLNPFANEKDRDVAIDKLREVVKLETRGGNVFRIVYGDPDPDRAKAVTAKLTELLKSRDEQLRNKTAKDTVEFAVAKKEESAKELQKHEQALAEFLAKHPEFAQDVNPQTEGGTMGGSLRNIKKPTNTAGSRIYDLERQRQRIQQALDAPADAPIRITAPPTPERIAAQNRVDEAERDVSSTKRRLDEALQKYTAKHPTVQGAQESYDAALKRLRQAEGAVPPETIITPTTQKSRDALQKELAQIAQQIASIQKGANAGGGSADAGTNWIVQLETEHAMLRRAVDEARKQVESLASAVFRAQMDESQKRAEITRLEVIDPAFKPVKPAGPGKTIFLLAGMTLFVFLGLGIAIVLGVIDDRLYRRADIDQLGIPVLAVIPAAIVASKVTKKKKKGKAA